MEIKDTSQPNIEPYLPSTSKFPKVYRNILEHTGDHSAHKIQVLLKQYLRFNIEVLWQGMEFIPFGDFISKQSSDTSIHILRTKNFQNYVLLIQDIKTISGLLERVLGAPNVDSSMMIEFTAIETAIVSRLSKMMLQEIQKAFYGIVDICWSIERHETNPALASILPDKENAIIMNFSIRGDLPDGDVKLCFSSADINPHLEKHKKRLSQKESSVNNVMQGHMRQLPVNVSVQFEAIKLKYQELTNLNVGDIIKLNHPLSEPAFLYVENKCKYKGKIGRVNNTWACSIDNLAGENPCQQTNN